MTQKLNKRGIYAMYLRKSRADMEAEKSGAFETLRHHEEILTDLAIRYGIKIAKVYKELESADTIADRPQVIKLLSDVQKGLYDGVLVTELSRLARGNTADQAMVTEAFSKHNTLIITPSKTYDPADDSDDTYIDFELFLARQEYKYIKKRMLAGRERASLDGYWLHAVAPFGWEKKDRSLAPSKDADLARSLLIGYGEGDLSIGDVVDAITKRVGSKWVHSSTQSWMKNPVHYGMKLVKKRDGSHELVKGRWDGIITEEQHMAIVRRLGSMPHVKKNMEIKNPLGGLVKCAKCGRALLLTKARSGEYFLYHVSSTHQPLHSVCEGVVGYKADAIYNMVVDCMEATMPYVEVDSDPDTPPDTGAMEAELAKLEKRMSVLYGFLEDGTYSVDEFKKRRDVLTAEISTIEKNLEKAKKWKPRPVETKTTKDLIDNLRDPEISIKKKNALLHECIEKITYDRKKGEEPDVIIYPKQY